MACLMLKLAEALARCIEYKQINKIGHRVLGCRIVFFFLPDAVRNRRFLTHAIRRSV